MLCELKFLKKVNQTYYIQIPKINATIPHWKKRILTPIGRVTVAKTLLYPRPNHFFTFLPNPDEKLISDFLRT